MMNEFKRHAEPELAEVKHLLNEIKETLSAAADQCDEYDSRIPLLGSRFSLLKT